MARPGHSGWATPGLIPNPEVKPATLEPLWGPRGPVAVLSRGRVISIATLFYPELYFVEFT